MGDAEHTLLLNKSHVDAAANDSLDKLGIAKNSREEKIRARDAKLKQDAENAKMAKLYREHVLGEKQPEGGFVPVGDLLGGIKPAPRVEVREEETVSGDD